MPNKRRTIASGKPVARSSVKVVFCVKSYGFHARDGAALIRRRGKGSLYPLDMTLTRPLSTFPDTQIVPSFERAHLRCLLARRYGGTEKCFQVPDWSPYESKILPLTYGFRGH